jgi:hypothetical protein
MLNLAWSRSYERRRDSGLRGLRLILRGRRGRGRLGLEVVVSEDSDEHDQHDSSQHAHIDAAAAATPAGALRLKIGIVKFCQRILPVVKGLFPGA